MKKLSAVFVFLIGVVALNAQSTQEKLRIIDSLCKFIRNEYGLYIPDDFYKNYDSRKDSMYVFMYVSRSERVEPADPKHPYTWYFNEEDSAKAKNAEMQAKGYETLIYKTAGTSAGRLSPKLLSYPPEAIAFIVLHEAVHVEVRSRNYVNFYNYEEALCDAFANRAAMVFAEQSGLLNKDSLAHQQKVFEEAYHIVNNARFFLNDATPAEKPALFQKCEQNLKAISEGANPFVQERLLYPINHAYFLRMECYAEHYFEMKEMLTDELRLIKALEILNVWAQTKQDKEVESGKEINLSGPKSSNWNY
ncbi:MAG: hypothetical protein U0V74_12400 [Chitinophagales bacterium]